MEKLKIVMAALLMVILLSITFINNSGNRDSQLENDDAAKFKQEYESLNEVKNGEREYKKISIPDDNRIIYATYEEIEKILTEQTGVIYFGFPECPWCRNAVPVLIDAAKELSIDKIYYFNALEIRDMKSLDENGNIIVEKDGTDEYKRLVEILYDYLDAYEGLNDSTIKRLYFPTIVFVKDGEIIGVHTGTVDSQTNPSISLTNSEYEELKDIYVGYMLKMLGTVCDSDAQKKC